MLNFPFNELRQGQDKIITAVETTINERGKLILHASTGMGKTAPVLYAALKAARQNGLKVLFLTAKHTHQTIAYETLKKMRATSSEDILFTGVNGKRSMCLFENNVEAPLFIEFCRAVREQGLCDFYKNTFSKSRDVKPMAFEALNGELSDPESIMQAGRKFELCPYELSLLNAKRSDVIVANYAHVFDPDIAQGFLSKVGLDPQKTVMVVDEAHNLHNRIIDMSSFSISLRTLERAYNEAVLASEQGIASKIDLIMSNVRGISTEVKVDFKQVFKSQDVETIASITKQNERGYNIPASFTLGRFATFLLKADETYLQYASKDNEHVKINIFALDPSVHSKQVINAFASSVLISGTFKPMDMFANLLGIQDAKKIVIEDSAKASNRLIINETDLTSKFSNRSHQFGLIAERISDLLENFRHNMIIFFPSYSFMESVYTLLNDRGKIIRERPKLEREEKQSLISELSRPNKCLFAVIGGNFSESIGIKNNIIRLVAIVGVPFEPPSIKLKAIQDYYQNKFSDGFEYAQVLPSMIKTLQAAGRGIRSSNDKAVILLIDSRFYSSSFRKYLPEGILTINGSPTKAISDAGFN